jgi:WD40 repeat protein
MTEPRGRALAVAGLLAALVLAGCSGEGGTPEEPVPGGGESTVTGTGDTGTGDAPGSAVLPDELSVSQDGTQVLADCWSGVCRWGTADGRLAGVGDGSHLALSPDWSLRAGTGEDGAVVLVDAESGDVVQELVGLPDEEATDGSPVEDVTFSADGSLVAAAGVGGRLVVWSVQDGAEVVTIEAGGDVLRLAFSPDGTRLATAGGSLPQVFDVPSGERVTELAPSSPDSSGLAWSPDGRWLAAPGRDGVPAVWSARDFTLADMLSGQRLEQAAFAPDSRSLAVTDAADTVVRLWTPRRVAPRRDVRELVGHTGEPGAVVFAPDGATLYSAAGDGILAWDVRTGESRELEVPET